MFVMNGRNTNGLFFSKAQGFGTRGASGFGDKPSWTVFFWFNAFTASPCSFNPAESDPPNRIIAHERGRIGTSGHVSGDLVYGFDQTATGAGTWKLSVVTYEFDGSTFPRASRVELAALAGLKADRFYFFWIERLGDDIRIEAMHHDSDELPDPAFTLAASAAVDSNLPRGAGLNEQMMVFGTDFIHTLDARGLLAYFGHIGHIVDQDRKAQIFSNNHPRLENMRELIAEGLGYTLWAFNDYRPEVGDLRTRNMNANAGRPFVTHPNNITTAPAPAPQLAGTPSGATWWSRYPNDTDTSDVMDAAMLTGIRGVAEVWINNVAVNHSTPLVGLVNGTEMWPTNSAAKVGRDPDYMREVYAEFPEAFPEAATESDIQLLTTTWSTPAMVHGGFSHNGDPATGFLLIDNSYMRTDGPAPAYLRTWDSDHTMIVIYQQTPLFTGAISMAMGIWGEWVRRGYGGNQGTPDGDPGFSWPHDQTLLEAGFGRSGSIWCNQGMTGAIRSHYSPHGGGGSTDESTFEFSQHDNVSGNFGKYRRYAVAASVYKIADHQVETFVDGASVHVSPGSAAPGSNPYGIPGTSLHAATREPFRMFGPLMWSGVTTPNDWPRTAAGGFRGVIWAQVFVRRAMSPAEIKALTDDITQFSGGGLGSRIWA